jgi:ABC-type nitrate/sulfonate/bicarbonate transport system substrate-binding protein
MKKILSIGLILMLLLTSVACSKPAQETTTNSNNPENKKNVINYPNTQWYDAVYIADAKGYFTEQNIEINYVGQIPAAQIVPSVAGRSIDFGLRHTPLIAIARAQGSPLKIVAAGTETLEDYPHMRYVIRKDSNIKSVDELAGKKVAINSFGACSEFVTTEFLKRGGVEGEINFVVLPDAQQEQALEQGLIDVAIVHAPFSKKATGNPALKELESDYAMDKGMSGMCPYFTHEDFIKENPEAVRGFVAAVSKASDWAKENEEEAKEIVAEKLKIKIEDVEPWAYYQGQVVKNDAVKWWIDYLEREGKLTQGQVKVEELYTNEFNPN